MQDLHKEYPGSLFIYNALGVTYSALDNVDDAIDAYQKAIDLYPDHAESYVAKANLLINIKELNDGLDHYKIALALGFEDFAIHYNMGVVLHEQGKLSEAISSYKLALNVSPNYYPAWQGMHNAMIDSGKVAGALSSFIEFPDISDKILYKFLTWDQELGWCPIPGLRKKDRPDTWFSDSSDEALSSYSIDDRGARLGYPFWHTKSKHRIGLFGDSFCMSREVDDNQTIGWFLSEVSNCKGENYGVGGYGLDQALLRFKKILSNRNKSEIFTDIFFIITPYTLARAVSVFRHYLEPGNVLAVKPRLANSPDGSLIVVPSPIKNRNDLKFLNRFADHFHQWDVHYSNEAWLVENLFEYYCGFWESEKQLFFSILAELATISNSETINIKIIMTHDKFFLTSQESFQVSPWAKTFYEASKIQQEIPCLDLMPNLVSHFSTHDEIWTRGGAGHLTPEANAYIANLLWDQEM